MKNKQWCLYWLSRIQSKIQKKDSENIHILYWWKRFVKNYKSTHPNATEGIRAPLLSLTDAQAYLKE